MVNFNLQSTFCEQALKEKYHVNIDGKAFNNDDDVDNVDGQSIDRLCLAEIKMEFWGHILTGGSILYLQVLLWLLKLLVLGH